MIEKKETRLKLELKQKGNATSNKVVIVKSLKVTIIIFYIFITGNQCYLTDPLNGHVNCSDNTATYSCDPCWQLVGNKQRTLSEDGIWTGYKPLCGKILLCNHNLYL